VCAAEQCDIPEDIRNRSDYRLVVTIPVFHYAVGWTERGVFFHLEWNYDFYVESDVTVLPVIPADYPHLPRYSTITVLHHPDSDRDRCECAAVAILRSRRPATMERLLGAEVESVFNALWQ